MDRPTSKDLLKVAYRNEDDYWELPQYAMTPDWFLRYWELHNLVLKHFGEQPYDYPEAQYKAGMHRY